MYSIITIGGLDMVPVFAHAYRGWSIKQRGTRQQLQPTCKEHKSSTWLSCKEIVDRFLLTWSFVGVGGRVCWVFLLVCACMGALVCVDACVCVCFSVHASARMRAWVFECVCWCARVWACLCVSVGGCMQVKVGAWVGLWVYVYQNLLGPLPNNHLLISSSKAGILINFDLFLFFTVKNSNTKKYSKVSHKKSY